MTLSQVARIEACAKRKRKSGALSPDFAAVANAPARSIRATIRSIEHVGHATPTHAVTLRPTHATCGRVRLRAMHSVRES